MSRKSISRRKFIASTSALLVASQLPAQETKSPAAADENALAMNGGKRAVKTKVPKLVRWGEPERERLDAVAAQDTLFYWKGPQTTALIGKFQQHYPLKYVMSCSSGTAAIHIAMAAAGIAPGEEVITTPISDIGSLIGILFQQAVPVFADVEPHTYNFDPKSVEKLITPKTKAILAVHLCGNPCRMEELRRIADKHNLILIEDSAQAWGAMYRGKPISTIGHIGCFSLQNSKQITCGDGGIVASNDERFGPRLQPFGDKGFDRLHPKAPAELLGPNYRMSEPQAAVAAAQMDRVEKLSARRSELGNYLTTQLQSIPGVHVHEVDSADRSTYHIYFVKLDLSKLRCDRNQFSAALRAEGVESSPGYISELLYERPVFQKHAFFAGEWPIKKFGLTNMDYTKVKCPVASDVLKTIVRIQVHEAMSEEYLKEVGAAVRKVAKYFAA
jgi:dTDP-4-amino-4,6-dideoxygalactose transaminase